MDDITWDRTGLPSLGPVHTRHLDQTTHRHSNTPNYKLKTSKCLLSWTLPAKWSCTLLSHTRSKYGGRRLEETRLVPPCLSPRRLGSSYSCTCGGCWVAHDFRHTAQSSTLPATTRGTSSTTRATRTQQSDGTRSRLISRSAGNVCPLLAFLCRAPNANVWIVGYQ